MCGSGVASRVVGLGVAICKRRCEATGADPTDDRVCACDPDVEDTCKATMIIAPVMLTRKRERCPFPGPACRFV